MLEIHEVVTILDAGENLRHIACKWAYWECEAQELPALHQGLIRNADTLETLVLDMRDVWFYDRPEMSVDSIGSLQRLMALKSLKICEQTLLGNIESLLAYPSLTSGKRISDLLPVSLRQFTILLHNERRVQTYAGLDDALAE
jgi:hypothetical protein